MKRVSEKKWCSITAPLIYNFGGLTTVEAINMSRSAFCLYSSEDRVYHAAYHPLHVIKYARNNHIKLTTEQEIALIFHDVIYKIGSKQNEEASALFTEALFKPFITNDKKKESLEVIKAHIRDSKLHFEDHPKLSHPDSALVLDLDICNMILPYKEFLQWNEAVEKEFCDFPIEKRIEFLKWFSSKEIIFLSDFFKNKEEKARENIRRLLKEKYE